MNEGGGFTSSKKETVNLPLDIHFPGSRDVRPELEDAWNEEADEEKVVLRWNDHDKVKRAMSSFVISRRGPDKIKPIKLRNLPDSAIDWLVHIFTACIVLGYTPKTWRMSKTVFIPKPGRDDYSIPKSFRPISLTSFCFKTLDRLVLWHLERTTFRCRPIYERQHTFRKGHSTELALSQVVNKIESTILQN